MTRKVLLALFFIGFAGNVGGGAGTFASFNASTTNATSSFATGSLVLSANHKMTTNTCFSNGTTASDGGPGTATDDNENAACDALFNVNTRQPGQTATVDLNIKNEGTLDGTLKLLVAEHTPTVTPFTPVTACSNRNTGAYNGTGDICQKLQLRVQRYTTDGRTAAPAGGCIYGNDTTPADGTCDASTVPAAASFNLKHFTETSAATTTGLPLGQLDNAGGTDHTAFLRISVEFPDGGAGADNAFQGRIAAFAMKWQLDQLPS